MNDVRTTMKNYYISRAAFAILFGGLNYLISRSIWQAVLMAALVMTVFFYLPRSGRYKVKPEKGTTALRRDEWTERISQRAGRNAWAAVSVAGSALVLYYGRISQSDVPVNMVGAVLILGVVVYFASDIWMRRL